MNSTDDTEETRVAPPWWSEDQHKIAPTDLAGARACWKAAVCLEATCFALMAIKRELEQELGEVGGAIAQCESMNVLVALIDPVNELEVEAAEEFERITGHQHPILFPY